MSALFDEMIRHQVGIERAKAGEAKKIIAKLAELDKRIIKILERLPENYTHFQFLAAMKKIQLIIDTFYLDKILSALNAVGRRAVSVEVDFAAKVVKKHLAAGEFVATPNKNEVFDKGIKKSFQGKKLPTWGKGLATDKFKRIKKNLQIMAVDNATPKELIAESKRQIKNANNNAATITKAYINQFTNVSRDEVYVKNNKFVKVIIWSSILDHRVTITCGVRGNKKYHAVTKKPIEHDNLWSGGPGVIHHGCRSVGIPVNEEGIIVQGTAKGEKFSDGEKTAIGGDEDYVRGDNVKSDGKIAKFPTPKNTLEKQIVPADQNYESWLRRQPRDFIEDSLGVEKARLFVDEKVKLERFVIPEGTELTLDKLDAA